MSFTVHGYISAVAYTLTVGDDGRLDGTDNVTAFLDGRQGDQVLATPTGPAFKLDNGNPESVLAALLDLTEVTGVDGNPPDLYEPEEFGTTY